MLLHLFFHISEIFVCDHDFLAAEQMRSSKPTPLLSQYDPTKFNTSNRHPFRIIFDTKSLKVGDCAYDKTDCEASAKLTVEKIKTIEETMENVKNFLYRLLNVTQHEGNISLDRECGYSQNSANSQFYTGISLNSPEPCDLYAIVRAQYYPPPQDSILAQAAALCQNSKDEDYNRPILGIIYVNVQKVPSKSQNFNSGARTFFMTILHEFTHVLGFSNSKMDQWINRETGVPFGSNAVVTMTSKYGPTHKFVKTPYLQKWINDRFQLHSQDVLDIGLMLEDFGSAGTAGSHPNEHLYFSEYMQGVTFGPGYLTGLTLNALLDTGWYDVNFTYQEPLSFLDSELYYFAPNETIVNSPPLVSFPSQFRCSPGKSTCFYDSQFKGVCSSNKPSSLSAGAQYGWFPQWYNPLNMEKIGNFEVLDYNLVTVPTSTNCRDPSSIPSGYNTAQYLEDFTDSSACMMSTLMSGSLGSFLTEQTPQCHKVQCTTDGRMKVGVKIDGEDKWTECKEAGQELKYSGVTGKIICPDPKQACAYVPKKETINILSVLPDRGPKDGGNLISMNGYDFNKYPDNDLNLTIAGVPCDIIGKSDSFILCKIRNAMEVLGSGLKSKLLTPLTLHAESPSTNLSVDLDDMYTFMNRLYNAGQYRFSPAAILLCFSTVIAIIASII